MVLSNHQFGFLSAGARCATPSRVVHDASKTAKASSVSLMPKGEDGISGDKFGREKYMCSASGQAQYPSQGPSQRSISSTLMPLRFA